jgi:hypothetical protein
MNNRHLQASVTGPALNQAVVNVKTGVLGARAAYEQAATRHEQSEAAVKAAKSEAGRSVALVNFVKYVREQNIGTRLTEYSTIAWPARPQELYAEAYALWILDPGFMETFYPTLKAFFGSGQYRPAS